MDSQKFFEKYKKSNNLSFIDMEDLFPLMNQYAEQEVRRLDDILTSKAAIDMHNEIGRGESGYEDDEEEVNKYRDENGEFDIDKWIKEILN